MPHLNLKSFSLGTVLLGVLAAAPALAGPPPAVWRPTLVVGAALPVSGGVHVGSEGAEWALPGGARVVASPDAELRVIGSPQHLDLAARRQVPTYTVVLKSGTVRVIVPDAATSAVIVAAPRKTSVLVASGEARVIAGAQVAVANDRGATSIGVGGQSFRALPAGTVEVVGAGRHALLASPPEVYGPSVLVAYDAEASLGAFAFAPVSGASRYRVELRETKTGHLVARAEPEAPSIPAGFAQLSVGAYSLRVTALDSAGFESSLPLERPLHVLRLGLPPGAYVDAAGIVYFPPGSRLGLEHADGVQMSYGRSGAFTPAPPSLELLRSEPRLVAFRSAGVASSAGSTELWLLPRKVHATIQFGGAAPRWPGAPLEINVRVEDPNREPAGRGEVKPSVSVGVESVPVVFKRDGAWLRGALPPQAGAGPWVVRVAVKDDHGLELGRDFIEIAAAH